MLSSIGTRKTVLVVVAMVLCVVVVLVVSRLREAPVSNSYYVALGSSFAAGLGLGERAPGSPFVSQRSVNGYPQQLARLLKVATFTDMTSSGSTVAHVLRGGQMGMPAQIDALGPDTRLVTLTAGGNDVGYVGDLLWMAFGNRSGLVGASARAMHKRYKTLDERDFGALQNNLDVVLLEIRRRSPQAKIVMVTYPAILPDKGTCPGLGISDEQAMLMRAVGDRLAQVTRDAATKSGAMIVDMAMLSAGHDACSAAPWVNGFGPKEGTSFHPTLAGAKASAERIAEDLK